jgi:hypothetical protein
MPAHRVGPGCPRLDRGERVLTTECDTTGAVLVATTLAAYQRPAWPSRVWSRLGWEEIGGVSWDARDGRLELIGLEPGLRVRAHLARRTPMVDLVRERVAATRLATARFHLTDGRTATVLVRRRPVTDEVVWVVLVNGVDHSGNGARDGGSGLAELAPVLRRLRADIGV